MTPQAPTSCWHSARDRNEAGPVSPADLRRRARPGPAPAGGLGERALRGGIGFIFFALLAWGLLALPHGLSGQTDFEKRGRAAEQPTAVAPAAAVRPEIALQLGHSGFITCVAFSPDGRRVLTGSKDGTARLWEAATGREVRVFEGHTRALTSVAFSPDGRHVLTGGDSTARLWSTAGGKEIGRLNHNRPVSRLALSPDGRQVLMVDDLNTLRQWDLDSGREIRVFGKGLVTYCAAFSPDGKGVLRGGRPQSVHPNEVVQWFDAAGGKYLRGFRTRTVEGDLDARFVAFSPDGRQVLAVGDRAVFWDAASGRQIRSFPLPRSITSVAFSADGKRLLTGGNDQVARLWDLASGKEIRSVQAQGYAGPVSPSSGGWLAVDFSPDGKGLLSGGGGRSFTAMDHVAQLWDAESGKEVRAFRKQVYSLTSAAFSPDGKQVLTAGEDKLVRLWDVAGGKQLRLFRGHQDPVNAAVFSPDGKQVLTGSGDPRSLDLKSLFRTPDGKWQGPALRAPLPGRDNTARLWDAASGKELRAFHGHLLYLRSVALSPDGTRVLTASADRTVRLWDAAGGKELRAFREMNRVWGLAFSPDGRQMLTGSDDPTHHLEDEARLWDLAGGQEVRVFPGGRLGVTSVAFSPDGKQVLTGGQVVRLWKTATGEEVRTFAAPSGPAAFSPDGKLVLAGGQDGTARLFDAGDGKQLGTFRGHTHAVTAVAFSPDGKQVLTGSGGDGSTRLWDRASGRELCRLLGFRDGSWVAITPDHYYTASRGSLEGVAFRLADRVFAFDQFDLKFNRPDRVLESIGLDSREVIAAYRHAYEKRLKRTGVREDVFGGDFHAPTVAVYPSTVLTTRARTLKLTVRAGDSKYLLDRLYVDVNGVPAHDSGGVGLRQQQVKTWWGAVDVELSSGKNRIDVSVLNEKGAESLKESVTIDCEAPAGKPDLYVVAVGVSDYQDARFRLTYADKDARDLADLFAGKRDHFGAVKVQRLLNRDATRENILKARDFLKASQVDDVVVVFFAGHGLLDGKLDYYFATADVDFKAPAERGLPYEAVEGLLDGIRARKKLLLMDTCHSGELDREDVRLVRPDGHPEGGIKVRTFRGLDLEVVPRVGLGNSYQLLQELFADLRRGTGAVVIASAAGAEYALESPAWKNGVFTHALLRGLKGEADRNRDGRIRVSELRDFVEQEVRRLTQGRQGPTARRENLAVDFALD